MARKIAEVTADVVDTTPITVAGVDTHPGWHALRSIAQRITTPLLPDDYLRLANPLWSARELRGRVVEVRRETQDSATLVIKPGWGFGSTMSQVSTSASECWSTAAGDGARIR